MVLLQDLVIYKDFGVAGAALVIVIGLSRWVAIRSFQYIEKATNALIENQNQIMHFAEETLSRNTEILSHLSVLLEQHIKEKDEAIAMIRDRDKTMNTLFEMLKQEIKINNQSQLKLSKRREE